MRTIAEGWGGIKPYEFGTLLYDLEKDPDQRQPLMDAQVEELMIDYTVNLMKENDAPIEQYERLGLKDRLAMAKGKNM